MTGRDSQMDSSQLLTIEQVSKVINRSEQTVRRMIKSGKLKAELMDSPYGKQYMIPSSEVKASYTTMEVIPLSRPVSVPALVEEVAAKVAEENAKLHKEIAELKTSQAELLATQKNILRLLQEQSLKTDNPWWKRIFS